MKPYDPRQDTHTADEDFGAVMAPRVRRPRLGARRILFAGVAGACVLGVGLGLWARPAMNERRVATAAPEPDALSADPAARQLRIVLDDRLAGANALVTSPSTAASPPGPIATPVAAAFATPAPQPISPPAPALPQAPTPTPAPIIRVQAPLPVPSPAGPAPVNHFTLPKLSPLMVAALAQARTIEAKLSKPIPPLVRLSPAPPTQVARAEPPPATKPKAPARPKAAAKAANTVQLAQSATAKAVATRTAADRAHAQKLAAAKAAAAHRIQLARAAEAHRVEMAQKAEIQKAQVQKAKVEQAKADRLERARLAKAQQAEQIKLAKAEARGRAEAKAEVRAEAVAEAREEARKQIRLASLARVVRQVAPHPARPAPPVQVAKLDRKHTHKGRQAPVVQQASLKARKSPHAAPPPVRSRPAPLAVQPHASGLMRVSAQRCALRDPGEALVCADPTLGAADRQLSRAYQGARAAGVPEVQLQRQQQRWLSARSAAAREAPWAVHDVYLARIAELNSQAHDARPDGY
ncbi:MAG TPA: hypothetical protein VFE10_15415 [Phenylobacterium sp.]|jgi:hypothetical protein|nr:hypothetical protein [Phenylobacterium sp.]